VSLLRGRFGGEAEDEFRGFASSLHLDLEMVEEELECSTAHAEMLGETGIVTAEESANLVRGLDSMGDDYRSGRWLPDDSEEDIHMAVEARLIEKLGDVGKKLHTARSRNDQVATTVRLWLRRRSDLLIEAVGELIHVLLDRVEADGRTLMPGYTHLQRGQPVLLGHHLLAHAWALSRDRERLGDARRRLNRCPLGGGAMAGTPHSVDRAATASRLGFSAPVDNAMDAVAARDHTQEILAACAITMTNLSRMAEELVHWSSAELAFVRIGEGQSTGSSIMPQKRNPDGAELVRGKAGRVFGHLQSLLVLVKGLPMAYNRDLQEDRLPLVDGVAQTLACLGVISAMWRDLEVESDRFENELCGDFSLATELADLLAERGVPFREAHELVAGMVRWCDAEGGDLTLLDGGRARDFHPAFPDDLGPWLDPRAAVERRISFGGTAWSEITRQVEVLRSVLNPG